MLPKVATTLLHSGSRAATAVQNQSHTIRNVLQLQSNSGPNSNRGGNGPSSGGSRYNTGSRSYHGSGRAVTQANTFVLSDVSIAQTDDSDESFPVKRVSTATTTRRSRRHSTSNSPLVAADRHEPLGSLQSLLGPGAARCLPYLPAMVFPKILPPPAPPAPEARDPSPLPEPLLSAQPAPDVFVSEDYKRLMDARSLDPSAAATVVLNFRQTTVTPTIQEFNAAVEALFLTRRPGEPLTLLLETYNDMIQRGLVPNYRTYVTLILALTDRDSELQWAIEGIHQRQKWNELGNPTIKFNAKEDLNQLRLFRNEANLPSILALFRAIAVMKTHPGNQIPVFVYRNLLRSCAYHGDEPGTVDGAIQIWSHLEKNSRAIPAVCFQWMIAVYGKAKDLAGAQEVFREFRKMADDHKVIWTDKEDSSARRNLISVWNSAITAYFQCGEPHLAVALLEEMLDAAANQTPKDEMKMAFGVYQALFYGHFPPPPSSSTFTAIIQGFVTTGDIDSAWNWFEQIVNLPHGPVAAHISTLTPTRPDAFTWRLMVEALVQHNRVEQLNALFAHYLNIGTKDKIELRLVDQGYIYVANIRDIERLAEKPGNEEAIKRRLDTLSALQDTKYLPFDGWDRVWNYYLQFGWLREAVQLCDRHLRHVLQTGYDPRPAATKTHLVNMTTAVYSKYKGQIPFEDALTLARLAPTVRYTYPVDYSTYLLQSYSLQTPETLSKLEIPDWVVVLQAAASLEVMPASVPKAFVIAKMSPVAAEHDHFGGSAGALERKRWRAVFESLGPSFMAELNRYRESLTSSEVSEEDASLGFSLESPTTTATTSPMLEEKGQTLADPASVSWITDRQLSDRLRELLRLENNAVDEAFRIFMEAIQHNRLPYRHITASLITALGRERRLGDMKHVYDLVQLREPPLESTDPQKFQSWMAIEDAMVHALAHMGEIEAAHVHRRRILEQGGVPSPDAYGALIYYVKDTTDDASNALALFHESQLRGVRASQYLYNNIISKVAKARKADLALELFTQMKAASVSVSSITYGAVIGACARVGDVASAETLFKEMTERNSFKPRVPPYNTMMQLYTTTKPNKERAFYYYNEMLKAGVRPSSYTYKLLIDAYMLDPHDIAKAEEVLDIVHKSMHARLEPNHIAAMINAYGCILKDLDKAIAFFDRVPMLSSDRLYDATVFEAMINVLVVHRRPDLIPKYLKKMEIVNVHMTAYVANVLIRAYAVVGDIEKAREVFEGMADPAQGMAAMNNHAPFNPLDSRHVAVGTPVYREPSTWEAMVRAELGEGHRDRALDLLERLKQRQFPEAGL
ncbi:uncharacterized protein EV420DRAFT_1644531 [Desarmillaria tabescens]|uniref:PROP1-like PPR domain-containing protein n=1 Tax=Armillaria tabescens TaxID=1929756 RepID=A0AA39K712_ARMTA|nr:uncharacterized protein EV420DRAFT_1644531 [Desarmillaria tabescens]KAK0455751.1 hypothetical protein EV420DRAFT_1644531 [Desarmillaria tabescens]